MKSGRLYSVVTKHWPRIVRGIAAIGGGSLALWVMLRWAPLSALEIAAGFTYLLMGADLLVRGAMGLARRLRMSPAVIGLTVLPLASTTPELSSVASAAAGGYGGLALGVVLGSIIANLFLIVGLAALVFRLDCGDPESKRLGPVLLGVCLLFAVMCSRGELVRWHGLALLAGCVALIASALVPELRRAARPATGLPLDPWPLGLPERTLTIAVFIVSGTGLLSVGAEVLVEGAWEMATAMQVHPAVIGASVIAIGTCLPEFATTITAAVQGRPEVAIGNAIGSSLLNLLWVMGLGALVSPVPIVVSSQVTSLYIPFMVLGAAVVGLYAGAGWRLGRGTGALLILIYLTYLLGLFLLR